MGDGIKPAAIVAWASYSPDGPNGNVCIGMMPPTLSPGPIAPGPEYETVTADRAREIARHILKAADEADPPKPDEKPIYLTGKPLRDFAGRVISRIGKKKGWSK